MEGKAYIHNNEPMLLVSNSFGLSIIAMVTYCQRILKNEGAKVVKKRVSNPKDLCIFAASLPPSPKWGLMDGEDVIT
jgi:hypothetical protein